MKFDRMNGPPLKTLEEQIWLAGFNAAKRPWVGLTEDEIWTLHDSDSYPSPVEFAQAIESKLREKNT